MGRIPPDGKEIGWFILSAATVGDDGSLKCLNARDNFRNRFFDDVFLFIHKCDHRIRHGFHRFYMLVVDKKCAVVQSVDFDHAPSESHMKLDLSSGFLWCAAFLAITGIVSWLAPMGLWFVALPVLAGSSVTSFFYYIMRRKFPWKIQYPETPMTARAIDFRSLLALPVAGMGLFALGQTSPQPPWHIRDGIDLVAAFVNMVVLGPIAEEVFFRGLLLNEMRRTNISIWASAALFAVSHINPAAFLSVFTFVLVSGVVLAKAASWTGSILAPITIHSTSNLLTLLTWVGWILPPGIIAITALVLSGACSLLVIRKT